MWLAFGLYAQKNSENSFILRCGSAGNLLAYNAEFYIVPLAIPDHLHSDPYLPPHILVTVYAPSRPPRQWMFEMSVKNGPSPGSFSFIFRRFKHTIVKIVLQQINVKKCPSSIRCWDLNPQPLEHESPPLTIRPGLPPIFAQVILLFLSRGSNSVRVDFSKSGLRFIEAGEKVLMGTA